MKKLIYITFLLIGGLLITSCQKDNVNEKDSNEETSTKAEKVPVKITVNYPNVKEDNYIKPKYDIFFKYDTKGRLEEINDRYFTKGYNIITNFEYNDKNQVIKATERDIRTEVGGSYVSTIVREYTYTNELLTSMTSNAYGDIKKEFEYNKEKQLIKVTHHNKEKLSYRNYTYDDRGNVKWKEKIRDNKGNIIDEIETTYDDKNNPFRYLNIPYGTKVSANIGSYEIEQLFFVNNRLPSGNSYAYEYTYDKDNYPIKMIEKHKESGKVERILTYEYKTLP